MHKSGDDVHRTKWKFFRINKKSTTGLNSGGESNRLFQYAFTEEDVDEDWTSSATEVGVRGRLTFYGLENEMSGYCQLQDVGHPHHAQVTDSDVQPREKEASSVRETSDDVPSNLIQQRFEMTPTFDWCGNLSSVAATDNRQCNQEQYLNTSTVLSHCHANRTKRTTSTAARNKLIVSCIICLAFMIGEVIGGYYANSLAIMTDASHLLSDFISFLISLLALHFGSNTPTKKMSFGYYRAEIIGALLSVFLIWSLAGVLLYSAVLRVMSGDYVIDADVMLLVSGIGIAVNIVFVFFLLYSLRMAVVLHGCCDDHEHGHTHGHQHQPASSNINVRAAFIHVLGDFVQSIGVMVAAIVIKFKPDYKLADPICTYVFSVLVILTTMNIIRDILHILMEGFPQNVDDFELSRLLKSIRGVHSIHDMHVWSLTVNRNVLAVHLVVDENVDFQSILDNADNTLKQNGYSFDHQTIQVEKYVPVVMDTCHDCHIN